MNLYAYAGLDPINASDPTGLLCRFRDKDGNCVVRTRERATEEEKEAARELARRINQRDRQVRELPDDARIPVVDKNGNQLGEISGREYKWLWNHIGVKIKPNGSNFGNGGAGGSSSLTERIVKVTPRAVATYAQGAVSAGGTREDGMDTLLFHELSHSTPLGRVFARQHRSHRQPWHNADWTREARTSTIGKAMLDTVGGNYVCALTRCE